MKIDPLLTAKAVSMLGQDPVIPTEMGVPNYDQMQGSSLEKLAELSGRICYDSLGKGRSSSEYHQHILEVGHTSVYEHCVWTVEIKATVGGQLDTLLPLFLNRPGVHVLRRSGDLLLNLNARAMLEWEKFTSERTPEARSVYLELLDVASKLMPQLFTAPTIVAGLQPLPFTFELRESEVCDEHKWASYYIRASRGLTHELVRHKYRTAVSQRSTRYVDEQNSPWVEHPLVTAWRAKPVSNEAEAHAADWGVAEDASDLKGDAQRVYATMSDELTRWLLARGASPATARKQARGAARGYLGNALSTELVFSASLSQWRRIIEQRATVHADVEIRAIAVMIFKDLRSRFTFPLWMPQFSVQPSPDGIGEIVSR